MPWKQQRVRLSLTTKQATKQQTQGIVDLEAQQQRAVYSTSLLV